MEGIEVVVVKSVVVLKVVGVVVFVVVAVVVLICLSVLVKIVAVPVPAFDVVDIESGALVVGTRG